MSIRINKLEWDMVKVTLGNTVEDFKRSLQGTLWEGGTKYHELIMAFNIYKNLFDENMSVKDMYKKSQEQYNCTKYRVDKVLQDFCRFCGRYFKSNIDLCKKYLEVSFERAGIPEIHFGSEGDFINARKAYLDNAEYVLDFCVSHEIFKSHLLFMYFMGVPLKNIFDDSVENYIQFLEDCDSHNITIKLSDNDKHIIIESFGGQEKFDKVVDSYIEESKNALNNEIREAEEKVKILSIALNAKLEILKEKHNSCVENLEVIKGYLNNIKV